jgi:hypothetical protein
LVFDSKQKIIFALGNPGVLFHICLFFCFSSCSVVNLKKNPPNNNKSNENLYFKNRTEFRKVNAIDVVYVCSFLVEICLFVCFFNKKKKKKK